MVHSLLCTPESGRPYQMLEHCCLLGWGGRACRYPADHSFCGLFYEVSANCIQDHSLWVFMATCVVCVAFCSCCWVGEFCWFPMSALFWGGCFGLLGVTVVPDICLRLPTRDPRVDGRRAS